MLVSKPRIIVIVIQRADYASFNGKLFRSLEHEPSIYFYKYFNKREREILKFLVVLYTTMHYYFFRIIVLYVRRDEEKNYGLALVDTKMKINSQSVIFLVRILKAQSFDFLLKF